MVSEFEEIYLDVLHNIEFAIVNVSRQQPDIVDYDIEKVLNTLLSEYQKQQRNQIVYETQLKTSAQQVYKMVKQMCEWRLGGETLETDDVDSIQIPSPLPISIDEIIACLKRVRKSVQMWNKRGGRRGYLQFIDEFIV